LIKGYLLCFTGATRRAGDNRDVVRGQHEELAITGMDPLVEQVELEINRLYLGGDE
jgi:hypothetical protein